MSGKTKLQDPPSFPSGIRKFRFGILLTSLLGMLAYAPFIDILAPGFPPNATRIVLGIIFGWLTISAVYAVSQEQKAPMVAVLLGALLLIAEIADLQLLRRDTHVVSHMFALAFLGHIVVVLLRYIFRQKQVDTDTIFASLCIYLLFGLAWAFAYSLIDSFQAEAFNYAMHADEQMRFGTEGTSIAIYFSFVTMTTLGYGDITPVSECARGMTMLQAIFGQLYLTVLVAWLVGLHIANFRVTTSSSDD